MDRRQNPSQAYDPPSGLGADAPLSRIISNASCGLLLLDSDHRIVDVGRGLCDLLGYHREELLGRPFVILLYPDDRPLGRLTFVRASDVRGQAVSVERRYLRKDGTVVWIIGSVSALAPAGPGEPAFVAQISTIDKQKQAEAAAAEALERWNFALEGAGQGVWDFNAENGTWFFSSTWKRMRGIAEDEVVDGNYQDWIEVIHPEDIERVEETIRRQNSGEIDEVAYEYRERHRDGRWIWILARGRCVEWDGRGRPRRIIGTDTDITAIKQRELDYAALSRHLELAVSTSGIGIWESETDTMMPTWDARTYEIFGVDPALRPLPSDAWSRLVHPDDFDRTVRHSLDAMAALRDYATEYRIITPNGEPRHVRSQASFTTDTNGRVRLIGVNWDITADVERAAALERAKLLAEERSRALEQARARMEHASLHDSLTGLPNRRCLDIELSRHLTGGRGRGGLTLLHIDLDRFKQINDTRGHAAGDAMLVHMAGLLRSSVRKGDMVARIGGDEFVVVLSPAPRRAAVDRLVARIIARASRPLVWEKQECRSGASIGIAEARGQVNPRQLLVNADIALYKAKRAGRNGAAWFTDQMQAAIIATKQCADDILSGLERCEFVPAYQPQFDARTLEIVGVEALVRWHHPQRGLLPPDAFLPAAEELNAVGRIDGIVLEAALADLARWDEQGLHVPTVSVNVSARRLGDGNLLASLRALSIQPGRVAFELLESIFLDESDDAMADNIAAIRELGIAIDVDDFGSGHASILSLIRLNPNRLKIDRQIIKPIVDSHAQRRLVRSIVEIGKSQGIEVCAEGVESAAHVDILRDLGCDSLQGYYFARPMSADDFTTFLSDRRARLPGSGMPQKSHFNQ